jgi:pimeloyl-ACP methyl ester carboxylesterase
MTKVATVAELLRARARETDRIPEDVNATVVLEADGGRGWTVLIEDGAMSVSPGIADRATSGVIADEATHAAVLGGTRSGVEAFLDGDLRVRGNLALALRLDSILGPVERPARWPKWGTARSAGVNTAFLEAGEGPPVVLLHGLGATNASVLPTLWDLARDHRVIAPDLPGFGESQKPIRSYDSSFFARWLRDFLFALDVNRADLIGNSMGGRVAIELALRAPHRVDKLVLLAPSPAFIKNREFVRLVRILRPELALIPIWIPHRRVVQGIRSLFSRPERLPDAWYEAAADEFLRVFRSPRARIAFFSAARQIYLEEPYGEKGFWDRLPSLSRPALFVWGERDRMVPARFARHVERAVPKAEMVTLEDCGHVPQYELPARTHELVRGFIGGST